MENTTPQNENKQIVYINWNDNKSIANAKQQKNELEKKGYTLCYNEHISLTETKMHFIKTETKTNELKLFDGVVLETWTKNDSITDTQTNENKHTHIKPLSKNEVKK